MPWRESLEPVRMRRVAILAPREALRDVLVTLAARGTTELEVATEASPGPAGQLVTQLPRTEDAPRLAPAPIDLEEALQSGHPELIAGEAQLEERAAAAVTRGLVSGVVGWAPAEEVQPLALELAPLGGAVVPLTAPTGVDVPSKLHARGRLNRSFAPLVDTYATVPYADLDPTVVAGLAFAVMFGMMFGDAGHGLLLLAGGLMLRSGRLPRLAGLQRGWPFVVTSAAMAIVFGVLFGEFFGPTGVLPVLWFYPLDDPILLLQVAVGVGACLLAGAYALGTANRWREGGWRLALVSPSGLAGIALFLGLGLLGLGAWLDVDWVVALGIGIAIGGLVLAYVGLFAASGGGAAGAAEAGVELFDGVIRLGTNVISFARIAAFGLAHAALGAVIWEGATSIGASGGLAVLAAIALFVAGNALTFTLEGIVAGVQALRLEYYELFSRIFVAEGRPFRPWSVPTAPSMPAGSAGPTTQEGVP
jgi:V/A-type H+-transporting ATPase subunit I